MSNQHDEEEYYSDDDEYNITFSASNLPTASTSGTKQSTQTKPITDGPSQLQQNTTSSGGLSGLDSISTLPDEDTALFATDMALYADKPWRRPGADVTDYFNYGFTEESWNIYCQRQLEIKRAVRQGRHAPIKSLNPNQQQHDDVDINYLDNIQQPPPPPLPQSQQQQQQQHQQQHQQRHSHLQDDLQPPPPPPQQNRRQPGQQQQQQQQQQQGGRQQQNQQNKNRNQQQPPPPPPGQGGQPPQQQQQGRQYLQHNDRAPPPPPRSDHHPSHAQPPPPPMGKFRQQPNDYEQPAGREPRNRQYQ